MAYNVFVSHSMAQEDVAIVWEAVRQARLRGVFCYMAERDWQFGNTLATKIEGAIEKCDCFVAFWTKGGAHSAFVNQEIGYARRARKHRILVVEKGVPLKGFDIGKEFIELDRQDPFTAVNILSTHLSHLSNLKSERERQQEKAGLFVLGAISLLLLARGGKK